MQCPSCGWLKTPVRDSRYKQHSTQKRRKRCCEKCGETFITLEQVVAVNAGQPLQVVKRDGRREDFDHHKLRKGVLCAVAKRPISTDSVDNLVGKVAERLAQAGRKEVEARQVGEVVMQELMRLDRVAYIRFASVYHNFKDMGAFREELESVEKISPQDFHDAQQRFVFGGGSGSGQGDGA